MKSTNSTPKRPSTAKRKADMLLSLEKSLGIVTIAALTAGIDRKTHYLWLDKDPKYKAAVLAIEDIALDFAESMLHKNIKAGKEASIIFHLKTKGKRRGYIERREITGEDGMPIAVNQITGMEIL